MPEANDVVKNNDDTVIETDVNPNETQCNKNNAEDCEQNKCNKESDSQGNPIVKDDTASAKNELSPETEVAPEQCLNADADVNSCDAENIQTNEKVEQSSNTNGDVRKNLSNEEVTEHTASLWKYLPVPTEEPEPTPEYRNETAVFPRSNVIAARVRGKKHKHEGTNCDDWYEVAHYDDISLIAVSDGAGSKKYSRIGAQESCKAAIGCLIDSFEKIFKEKPGLYEDLKLPLSETKCMEACGNIASIVQTSVLKAREAVETAYFSRKSNMEYEKSLGRSLQLKDFSSTLLIAVIIPINNDIKEHLVVSCQIGDGMIVIINSKGTVENSLKLMGVPDSGDFSGETDFLTSSKMQNVEELQQRTKVSRTIIDTLMVMSDGVADDYFPNETQMRRLYFDLVVNDIIDCSNCKELDLGTLTPDQMKLFKRIPDPLSYPWVNDQSVKISLQYTNRIMVATNISLNELWNDMTALNLARLEIVKKEQNIDKSEKLKIWLDNYVERGSFDDRTLVIVTI